MLVVFFFDQKWSKTYFLPNHAPLGIHEIFSTIRITLGLEQDSVVAPWVVQARRAPIAENKHSVMFAGP